MKTFKNFIIFEDDYKFEVTTKQNYYNYISDSNKILKFYKNNGFNTFDEVCEYIQKYIIR